MRFSPNTSTVLLAAFSFHLSLLAPIALAQSAGTVRGLVTDPSASVIPAATMQISGNGVSRSVKTDGQGRYTVTLPVGTYTIQVNAAGFLPYSNPRLNVSAGQVTSLDISLQIATQTQQVQVSDTGAGQVSTDPSNNAGALVLRDADLDQLPDDPDDLQTDLEALAGPAQGPNGAQFFIDGFSGGQLPPKSSIREIRINSNPFSSEFDRPGFGRVEIFTKPGTDKYHGQAFFDVGDDIFDTRNPLLTTSKPGYTSKLFTGNFGGPLSKKASFLIDFNRREIDAATLIDARTLDNSFNEIFYNGSYPTPQRLWIISPRLDYQLSTNNTLVIRYNHTANSTIGGVGQFSLPTQQFDQEQKNNLVQITETAVLGMKAVDETRFQFFDSHVNQIGVGNFSIPGINVSSSFNSGGAPFSVNYADTKTYELQNIITLTNGNHATKIGGRLRQSDLSSQTTSNFNGTYTFAQPVQPPSATWCLAGVPDPTSLNLYQETQLLLTQGVPIAQILAEGCGPTQFTLSGGIPLQTVRQLDLGLFVQDDWRLRRNLTISTGLRYETQNNIRDHEDLAPRFAVAWAPGGSNTVRGGGSKTVFRGGWGVFFDRFPEADVLNALRYNGFTQTNYVVNNALAQGGNAAAQEALAYYPNLPPLSLLTSTTQAIYQVASNLRTPYMMQGAIGVDRSLPGRTTLSLNLVDTRGLHVLRLRDINAYLPGTYTGPGTGIRPYPTDNDIYQYESSGIFKQFQAIANINSRINDHISLQGYYVYGQAHSNANGVVGASGATTAAGFPMNQYNDNADYGRASFDVRNRAFIGGNLGLPFGWVIAPFVTMSSGSPFNITTGSDFDGDGIFNQRPALASGPCGPSTPNIRCTKFGTFNITPAPGEPVIPYDYGNGPAQYSVNFRLSRTWGWGERAAGSARPAGGGGGGQRGPGGFGGGRGGGGGGFAGGPRGGGFGSVGSTGKKYNLTFGINVRNALNHVNYGLPNGLLTSPFFGQSTTLNQGGGNFGGAGTAAGNRRVELQLRFQF